MELYQNKKDVIIELQRRGYDQDFELENEGILYLQQSEFVPPDEFEITETYRIADRSRRKNKAIVYAVKSVHSDLRGILVTSIDRITQGLSIHLWSKLAGTISSEA